MKERNWKRIAEMVSLQVTMLPTAQFNEYVGRLRQTEREYTLDDRPALQALAPEYREVVEFLEYERSKTEAFWRRQGVCDGCGTGSVGHRDGCRYGGGNA